MLLEICAGTYQSAINAQNYGAHRIELCKDLEKDGLTPDKNTIRKVLNKASIPVHILIRPRSGNFVYSNTEFEYMKRDILFCKSVGCKGIVSGVLHTDGSIDVDRTSELVRISRPLSFTFHRAFGQTPDPLQALKDLAHIGVNRILTSGQKDSAVNGVELLKNLKDVAAHDLIVMPGAGISPENAELFLKNGFKEIHASARSKDKSKGDHSDPEVIKAILKAISE